jgi:cytochrome P450
MQAASLEIPDVRPVRTGLPPGPTTPWLVQTIRFITKPVEFVDDCARQFGDCFTTRLLGRPAVTFSHPDAVREILTADPEVFRGGEATAQVLEPIIGRHSILVLDGERHLRERRLLLPPFHGERMHAYARIIREVTERVVDGWPIGQPFAVHRPMQAITLEVIVRAVFGLDEGPELARLTAHLEEIMRLANSPSAALLFVPAFRLELGGLTPWGRYVRNRAGFRAILGDVIARRRREGTAGRSDILSMLLEARDEEGRPMSDAELFDEMFTLLMAGHETTASALSWTFWQALSRPEVVAGIRQEVEAVTGGAPVGPDHVGRLAYLDAVVKETARLTPVANQVARTLAAPAEVGGWSLPAGVMVTVSMQLAHRHPAAWREPERFDPTRFLGTRPNPYAFFPFGGGERRCIGAAFATYEMKIVLAEVLRRTDLRLVPGYRPRPVLRAVTLGPSDGVPIVVEARRPVS